MSETLEERFADQQQSIVLLVDKISRLSNELRVLKIQLDQQQITINQLENQETTYHQN